MKNERNMLSIIFQGIIAAFLAINIAIASVTEQTSLFSYICCNILGIMQSIILICMFVEENEKR